MLGGHWGDFAGDAGTGGCLGDAGMMPGAMLGGYWGETGTMLWGDWGGAERGIPKGQIGDIGGGGAL